MTTKAQALHTFFSSFGLTAYAETSVPDGAQPPYITYTPVSGAFGDGHVPLYANIWMRGESEAAINAKAEQLGAALGDGGVMLPHSGGSVWLTRGAPFCQSMQDEDGNIKRRYINITAEFI